MKEIHAPGRRGLPAAPPLRVPPPAGGRRPPEPEEHGSEPGGADRRPVRRPSTRARITAALRSRDELRKAFMLHEVLEAPVALRRTPPGSHQF